MAYDVYLGTELLPVTPAKINIKIKNQNKTANLINDGEINFLKDAGLTEVTFDVLLPNQHYHFARYLGGFKAAGYYLNLFERLKVEKKPFQLIISRATPGGTGLYGTNMAVSMEDYTVKEDAGEAVDTIVSLKLKQYVEYKTKTVELLKGETKTEAVVTENREAANAPTADKHTVRSGDTLWGIAKIYYGDGAKWKRIAEANSQIQDPDLIYPGWELVIPKEG